MSMRSESNPRFFWRFALIGVVLLGWTGLCFKDALYSYPRKCEAALAKYEELRESKSLSKWTILAEDNSWPELPAPLANYQALLESNQLDKWPQMAYDNNWDETPPDDDEGVEHIHHKIDTDIIGQYVMAAVSTPLGLWALMIYFLSRGRWMEADDNGIRSSWGQQLAFSQIVTLDKKKWNDKGIAKIAYDDNGRRKRFVLDDCKYFRSPTEDILRVVEANIEDDQIVNGFPEADIEAEQEPAEASENGL